MNSPFTDLSEVFTSTVSRIKGSIVSRIPPKFTSIWNLRMLPYL